jgi:hypothetical protein
MPSVPSVQSVKAGLIKDGPVALDGVKSNIVRRALQAVKAELLCAIDKLADPEAFIAGLNEASRSTIQHPDLPDIALKQIGADLVEVRELVSRLAAEKKTRRQWMSEINRRRAKLLNLKGVQGPKGVLAQMKRRQRELVKYGLPENPSDDLLERTSEALDELERRQKARNGGLIGYGDLAVRPLPVSTVGNRPPGTRRPKAVEDGKRNNGYDPDRHINVPSSVSLV